jgi:hypothetical protein
MAGRGLLVMRQYERILEEKRHSRRTIADALQALWEVAGFGERDQANIRVSLLGLPSGIVGLVDLIFEAPLRDRDWIVSLPTSAKFTAKRQVPSKQDIFDIARLDGASVDFAGKVILKDGEQVRAVEIEPLRWLSEPSDLDWRIVHHTLAIIGAQERCYRQLEGTELRFLDCGLISGLKIPPLKVLQGKLADCDPTLKKLSQQKIVDALQRFGIRVPSARPRVRARPQ